MVPKLRWLRRIAVRRRVAAMYLSKAMWRHHSHITANLSPHIGFNRCPLRPVLNAGPFFVEKLGLKRLATLVNLRLKEGEQSKSAHIKKIQFIIRCNYYRQ